MSDVTTGFGSQLFLNVSNALVKVAEIDDIPELPNFTTATYETTSYDTVAVKEFKKQPLKEGAEITITGNCVLGSDSVTTLEAAEASKNPIPYRILLTQDDDQFEVTGSALFYNLKFTNPGDAKRKFSIVMKPTAAAPVGAVASGGGA